MIAFLAAMSTIAFCQTCLKDTPKWAKVILIPHYVCLATISWVCLMEWMVLAYYVPGFFYLPVKIYQVLQVPAARF